MKSFITKFVRVLVYLYTLPADILSFILVVFGGAVLVTHYHGCVFCKPKFFFWKLFFEKSNFVAITLCHFIIIKDLNSDKNTICDLTLLDKYKIVIDHELKHVLMYERLSLFFFIYYLIDVFTIDRNRNNILDILEKDQSAYRNSLEETRVYYEEEDKKIDGF